MNWQPIETAPKGEMRMVTVGKATREMHVAPRIVSFTSVGLLTITYWMPESGRWNMFSAKNPPTHWLPIPDIPMPEGGDA